MDTITDYLYPAAQGIRVNKSLYFLSICCRQGKIWSSDTTGLTMGCMHKKWGDYELCREKAGVYHEEQNLVNE